ncbi:hypothetical protein K6U67_21940, partial [Vibrio diabolicus]|nr:hypothetical protein [Vibrio diabolicus]
GGGGKRAMKVEVSEVVGGGHRELVGFPWDSDRLGYHAEKASIEWLFNVDKARNKLHRAYDELTIQN